MKLPHLISMFLLPLAFTQCSRVSPDEIVNIPDTSFRTALIEQGVDQNKDGIITYKEAEEVLTIDLWGLGISDLTGLEAFVNLDTLRSYMNPLGSLDLSGNKLLRVLECVGCELTALDVSGNLNLEYLDCAGSLSMENYLTSLDVSQNAALEYLRCEKNQIEYLVLPPGTVLKTLRCGYNQMTDIDVGGNPALTTFTCNNNLLTSLDISGNTALIKMISCGNDLTFLDISKNINLTTVGFDNMPMLTEVCVWTLPFPPAGVSVLMGFSPNVEFTLDCAE